MSTGIIHARCGTVFDGGFNIKIWFFFIKNPNKKKSHPNNQVKFKKKKEKSTLAYRSDPPINANHETEIALDLLPVDLLWINLNTLLFPPRFYTFFSTFHQHSLDPLPTVLRPVAPNKILCIQPGQPRLYHPSTTWAPPEPYEWSSTSSLFLHSSRRLPTATWFWLCSLPSHYLSIYWAKISNYS